VRHLLIVLGDQLDENSAVFDGLDSEVDRIWMAEAPGESTQVWSHKARIAVFLSAMRHFRDRLIRKGFTVVYRRIGEHACNQLSQLLRQDIVRLQPVKLIMVQTGEFRVQQALETTAKASDVPLELRPDRHFMLDTEGFSSWARGRRELRAEHLYRHLRKKTGILMEAGQPLGGRWNFDDQNRQGFGREGPPSPMAAPLAFAPDGTTQEVLLDVETHFPHHPGSLADFHWPLTPEQAEQALGDFIAHRLPSFGPFQDAMWSAQPFLFHSRLSSALNLKLISPGKVMEDVLAAYHRQEAPLASVEGFIRQILGWREFVHGVYWLFMPDYLERNALQAYQPLPGFYWDADIDLHCLQEALDQTLRHGYAHHIQRLMVTGLFALLLGVEPKQVHSWYLAVYVDAVEWVELPNTLGMSQYADGGVIASKPYVATGRYIDRMSNYCQACRYDPKAAVGANACPFTTLYWDFLHRHRERFAHHPRTALQWRNLERLDPDRLMAIRRQADRLRDRFAR